jgi:hypothetical protein
MSMRPVVVELHAFATFQLWCPCCYAAAIFFSIVSVQYEEDAEYCWLILFRAGGATNQLSYWITRSISAIYSEVDGRLIDAAGQRP